MNRNEARKLWERVASGELGRQPEEDPVDLHAWICEVATKLLAADDTTEEKQRPYDITSAVGLYGALDNEPELRYQLGVWMDFDPAEPYKRGQRRAQLVAYVRAIKPRWSHLTDKVVYQRVERLLKDLPG